MSKFIYFNTAKKVWSAPPLDSFYNTADSLGDILLRSLSVEPDKISEVHDVAGVVIGCEDIRTKSLSVSEKIKSLNVKEGDVVTFACRNFLDLSSLICGCILSGVVVNPVNPEYSLENFKQVIKSVRPKVIFCNKQNKTIINNALEELCHIANVVNVDNDLSIQTFFEPLSNNNDNHSFTTTKGTEKTTLILVTAGTTGPPKCVTLTDSNVIYQLLNMISIEQDDVVIVSPYMHLVSGIATTLIGLATGATRIVSTTADIEVQFKLVEKYKVTKLLMSPAHLSSLVDSNSFKATDLSSVKLIQTGGEALMKTLKELVESQLLNGKVVQSYGLVECAGTVTLNYPISKEYSVGRPVLENKFKIIDESGNHLGPNEEGEICIKPATPFVGYCFDKMCSQENVDQEGYFRTGDIGYFDDDSFLFIVGRIEKVLQYTGYQL